MFVQLWAVWEWGRKGSKDTVINRRLCTQLGYTPHRLQLGYTPLTTCTHPSPLVHTPSPLAHTPHHLHTPLTTCTHPSPLAHTHLNRTPPSMYFLLPSPCHGRWHFPQRWCQQFSPLGNRQLPWQRDLPDPMSQKGGRGSKYLCSLAGCWCHLPR